MSNQNRISTQTLVMSAIMTAFVVVFQLLGTYTAFFGPFSTAVGLIPIAIGAMLCGPGVGAWLGFVFSMVVLFTRGANLFLACDVRGTIITVIVKGVLCGFASGLVYKMLKNFNSTIAAIAAAFTCPIVNTGLFLAGCALFLLDDVAGIAEKLNSEESGMSLFYMLATANFIFELGMSAVVSPIAVKLLRIRKKQ